MEDYSSINNSSTKVIESISQVPFEKNLASKFNSGVVLIQYYKEDCVPCAMLKKSISKLMESPAESEDGSPTEPVQVIQVDTSDDASLNALSQEHHVNSVPYTILLRNGVVWEEFTGFQSPRNLQVLLNNI